MAAPTFYLEGTGIVTTSAVLNVQNIRSDGAGTLFIIQIAADGNASVDPAPATASGDYENLAGTVNQLTKITPAGGHPIGAVAEQHLFVGRSRLAAIFSIVFDVDGGVDHYGRSYSFTGVNSGATLADILENGTAGVIVNGVGLSTTVADTGVTTLGADRLAVQFVAVNDDVAIGPFTGTTGGTWAEAVAEFASATGTDACIQLQTATIASAGTINGGTVAIASASWGVIGFALKPPGASGTAHTATPADTVALADLLSRLRTSARTPADAVALTDTFARVATFARTRADTVALTDSCTPVKTAAPVNHTRDVNDTVALADSLARARTAARTITDTVATSDTAARARTAARTVADTVSLVDAAARQRAIARAWGDVIGTEFALNFTIPDSVATVRTFARTITDSLTLADLATPGVPPIADFVGVPVSGAIPLEVVFTDLSSAA